MPDPFGTLPLPLPIIILNGLEDLGTLNNLSQNSNTFRADQVLDDNAGTTPLGKTHTKLGAVRSLAKTASQVQNLSASFFKAHLERVNSIKPYRSLKSPVAPKMQWVDIPGADVTRYDIVECEEPSWIEEQRVLRALWRIVAHWDLLTILRPSEGDDPRMWRTIRRQGPRALWSKAYVKGRNRVDGLAASKFQEINCVSDFLVDIHYGTSKQLQSLPIAGIKSISTPKPTPCFDGVAEWKEQSLSHLNAATPAFYTFRANLPVHNMDFWPLQLLGLGIWDVEKLSRLGLLELPLDVREESLLPSHEACSGLWDLIIRWRSLSINDSM
ncbi:MAG: hypothetical protein Q9181_002114 [Wetmoreana brouardii]